MIFLGAFGLIFGFIGGALIDQLTAGLRQKNRLKKFLSNPVRPRLPGDTDMLCSAAGASVIWHLCRNEPARLEVAESALPLFFPGAPRYCAETLSEYRPIDYAAAAEYFGREADDKLRESLKKMIVFCGLEHIAARAAAGDMDTARILAAAGYRAGIREFASGDEEDYMILGLERNAPQDEIKKQYHKLAALFHPDTSSDLSPEQQRITEDAFKRIQAAYERLCGN